MTDIGDTIIAEALNAGLTPAAIAKAARIATSDVRPGKYLNRFDARRVADLIAAHEDKMDAAVIAAAERVVAAAQPAPRATEAQVAYIMRLLAQRGRDGDGDGFYSGPTTREGVVKLTRSQASTYIDSLKGAY